MVKFKQYYAEVWPQDGKLTPALHELPILKPKSWNNISIKVAFCQDYRTICYRYFQLDFT
ncbi:MAG: hypothetical protein A3A57_01680 [Candidatus Woykebacteria bacterium RIFCSPLOWO2_01_FULL_41_12]|uniref:Uncharacterized protein n=1 Tax=Candidatus Woykebacteria bacterium RIFCSPLOWO2_01_FULL_41_12 TaxID=1802604 RepID=A0A1G1WUZ7_9BACT|nr:MAG: hypothetical protein A3A57_01680 [Candidatus Woykebacteria bacterium RIFCSPLOWO2_01_FULL_41_12]